MSHNNSESKHYIVTLSHRPYQFGNIVVLARNEEEAEQWAAAAIKQGDIRFKSILWEYKTDPYSRFGAPVEIDEIEEATSDDHQNLVEILTELGSPVYDATKK